MKPRIRLRFSGVGFLAAALMLLTGCDYFRPSQPSLPPGGFPVSYVDANATLNTMNLAIEDKAVTNGRNAYLGALANVDSDGQGFNTTFDPLTVARFPGEPTDWSYDREAQFYSNLSIFLTTSTFLFTWGDFQGAPDDEPTAVPAVFYRSYLLQATSDGGNTFRTVGKGNAELHFIRSGDQWKLVHWIDHEDPSANFELGEVSFGQLRLSGP